MSPLSRYEGGEGGGVASWRDNDSQSGITRGDWGLIPVLLDPFLQEMFFIVTFSEADSEAYNLRR